MAQNIFEEFQEQKAAMVGLIEKAAEFKWIDNAKRDEMLKKLQEDILTVGVIGQMKCGKSTFLNDDKISSLVNIVMDNLFLCFIF